MTFVTKYGLEKAEELLDENTKNAIKDIEMFGEKAGFLKELAVFIKDRNK